MTKKQEPKLSKKETQDIQQEDSINYKNIQRFQKETLQRFQEIQSSLERTTKFSQDILKEMNRKIDKIPTNSRNFFIIIPFALIIGIILGQLGINLLKDFF